MDHPQLKHLIQVYYNEQKIPLNTDFQGQPK